MPAKNMPIVKRGGFRVKELMLVLFHLNPDAYVVLSSDPEGNDFGTLYSIVQDEGGEAVILFPRFGTVEFEP